MKTFLLAVCMLFFAAGAYAQTPDCVIGFSFNAASQASSVLGCGHNAQGVTDWRMVYFSNGFSALSIVVQSAPDSSGSPGSWVTFAGTVVEGSNPNTTTTNNSVHLQGYYPWVRVFLTSKTGTGTITGVLYGCRNPGCSTEVTATFSGGGLCIAMTPCIVVGPAADGAAVSGNPVRIGGKDPSGNTQDILTNAAGNMVPSNDPIAGADGVSNTAATPSTALGAQVYNRMFPYLFNGNTNDRDFSCPNSLRVNVAATGPTEIIPLTAGQTIRVCNFQGTAAGAASMDVSFVRGTGTNCGTGTATIAGAYSTVTALYLFSKDAPLTVANGNALCLTNSASTAFTGVVIYAKY